jgi:parallel beta-helix repeat protein
VFPNSPTAIQDAVDSAKPGDVVLVHKGVYQEDVQVPSGKDNIRIVSKDVYQAIMDGNQVLLEAFALNGVAGVEIAGFQMKNYRTAGIRIFGGKSNRILQNHIRQIVGEIDPNGIFVNQSVGNLMMKNTIERIGSEGAGTGILLNVVTGNWVVQNQLRHNASFGIEVADSSHNALIRNQISGNHSDGAMTRGSDNNLFSDNDISQNGNNGVNAQSTNNLIVNSRIADNAGNGLLFGFNYNFAGFDKIKDNRQAGINVLSDFNDMQDNKIEKNRNDGIRIESPHTGNFVFDNKIKENTPLNINDFGVDNNILQNKEKY